MIESNDKYWLTQDDYEYYKEQKEIIDQLIKVTLNGNKLIYRPARQHRMFCYGILNYYYRNMILSLKNDIILDDLRLSTKYCTWYFNSTRIPIKFLIPITFEEFLNNRSLSKYIQKASKEI